MTTLSYRIAIAEETSVAPLIVQPPFKSRKGELVLVGPVAELASVSGGYFWIRSTTGAMTGRAGV